MDPLSRSMDDGLTAQFIRQLGAALEREYPGYELKELISAWPESALCIRKIAYPHIVGRIAAAQKRKPMKGTR